MFVDGLQTIRVLLQSCERRQCWNIQLWNKSTRRKVWTAMEKRTWPKGNCVHQLTYRGAIQLNYKSILIWRRSSKLTKRNGNGDSDAEYNSWNTGDIMRTVWIRNRVSFIIINEQNWAFVAWNCWKWMGEKEGRYCYCRIRNTRRHKNSCGLLRYSQRTSRVSCERGGWVGGARFSSWHPRESESRVCKRIGWACKLVVWWFFGTKFKVPKRSDVRQR